jgi:hypothetical protein
MPWGSCAYSVGIPRNEDGIGFVSGDLTTGQEIAAAVTGIGTIVHCAGSAKADGEKARVLIEAAAATRRLVIRSYLRHIDRRRLLLLVNPPRPAA